MASIANLHVCSSKVYAADLESGLHYLLRVELASHDHLEGEELAIFKDFVTLVAKVTGVAAGVERSLQNRPRSSPLLHLFLLSSPGLPPPLSCIQAEALCAG